MTDITYVPNVKASLGEGPCWDVARQCLWWVDIWGRSIHRFDPGTQVDTAFAAPGLPASLAIRAGGGLMVAMGDGFFSFDPESGDFALLGRPAAWPRETRFNDGRPDRHGRFWVGSMHEEEGRQPTPIGGLYRLDAKGECRQILDGIAISNGLAWSPDGRTMYHADSCRPFVWAWDYDPLSGDIDNRCVFVDLSGIGGVADGATVDAEGCYWVALPFKGLVHRYDPSGALIREIVMPVDGPTCCEFGGAGLDTLYVTSGNFARSPEVLASQPLAGGLFAVDAGVKGLPATLVAA